MALQTVGKFILKMHQETITLFSRVVMHVAPHVRVKVSRTTGVATFAAFIAQIVKQRKNIKWRYPKELAPNRRRQRQ
jgi:hypothetical protein